MKDLSYPSTKSTPSLSPHSNFRAPVACPVYDQICPCSQRLYSAESAACFVIKSFYSRQDPWIQARSMPELASYFEQQCISQTPSQKELIFPLGTHRNFFWTLVTFKHERFGMEFCVSGTEPSLSETWDWQHKSEWAGKNHRHSVKPEDEYVWLLLLNSANKNNSWE